MKNKLADYKKDIDEIDNILNLPEVKRDIALKEKLNNIKKGVSLEKSMARKLKIAFENKRGFKVFNDIKLDYNGITAQIDHLILTCYSAYFIESKSCYGTIHIDKNLNWKRIVNGQEHPFTQSPVNQSKEHEDFLYNILNENLGKVIGKFFGIQKHLSSYEGHHYIAIGHSADITGDGYEQLQDIVLKYDHVIEKIKEHHKKNAKGYLHIDKCNDDFKTLSSRELDKMEKLILEYDNSEASILQAFNIKIPQTEIDKTAIPPQPKRCNKCNAEMIIDYVRNYYWKCLKCGNHLPIKEKCSNCHIPMKVTKSNNKYSLICKKCNKQLPYYIAKPEK
jgi:hypothetical protein